MPFTVIFLVAAICGAVLGVEWLVAVHLIFAALNEGLAAWARHSEEEVA